MHYGFHLTRRLMIVAALAAMVAAPAAGFAVAALGSPQGEPLLTLAGNLSNPNSGSEALFDRAMLAALPQHEIRTTTEWTDGVKVFRGPLMRDVLAAAGASGTVAVATALNDYSVEIPVHEFHDYPVILAMTMDGKELTVRTKGPIWVVYPRDDYAELRNSEMNSRWIWQLRKVEIR